MKNIGGVCYLLGIGVVGGVRKGISMYFLIPSCYVAKIYTYSA
jgi:hypothetical protein